MNRFLPDMFCFLLSCALLLFAACPAAAEPQPPSDKITFTHTVVQTYGGDLSDETAYEAAATLARHALVDMLAGWLTNHSALSLAFSDKSPRPVADALLGTLKTDSEFLADSSSAAIAVTATASIIPAQAISRAKELLLYNDMLMLHANALQREQSILDTFVALSGQRKEPDEVFPQGKAAYNRLIFSLQSMQAYRDALPLLQPSGIWQAPDTVKERMRAAIDLDKNNPLAWNALGEVHYQMEQAIDAVGEQDTAIRLAPEFARAWHARGTAYLKLSLTELALEDFTRAITLQPEQASHWQARGAAYLVTSQFELMCRDYAKACSLGQCENLHWARSRGHCPEKNTKSAAKRSDLP